MTTTTPDSDQTPPGQGLMVASPGFAPRPRPPTATSDPLGAETTIDPPTATPSPEDGEGLADELGEGYSDEGDGSTSTTTPGAGRSRGSTPDVGLTKLLTEMCAVLVGAASVMVRYARQRRRPYELPPGVWIADDDDRAAIAGPLASIAARHAPMSGEGSEDVVDGFAALIGTANYAMKGLAGEQGLPPDVDPERLVDVEPTAVG